MKRSTIATLLLCAVLAFLFTSCGSNDTTNQTTTDTTKMGDSGTAKTVAPETPASTIVTTPTSMVVVMHKVANYAKWQTAYDGHDSARLANGLHNYVIARGFKDSNMVMVVLKADDMTKAKAFTKDPGLKKAMQQGGVTGAPTISFLTATWQDTAILAPNVIRSRTVLNVKDWDTWFKNFEANKQERMDNGIVDRVIGHDADNDKKVSLVTAVTDSTKAFAFYKSDLLKKRRAEGGVIGEPSRFLFQIVKRY